MRSAALFFFCSIFVLIGCDDGPNGPPRNPNIVQLLASLDDPNLDDDIVSADPRMAVWADGRYYFVPLGFVEVDDEFNVLEAELQYFKYSAGFGFVDSSPPSKHIATIRPYFNDNVLGSLYEIDLQTETEQLLRDSTYTVGAAVYRPASSERQIIYYSYGSDPILGNADRDLTPGFYLMDPAVPGAPEAARDSLLFPYRPDRFEASTFVGFDVSPDGERLLVPLRRVVDGQTVAPLAMEVNLSTGMVDTLAVRFDSAWQEDPFRTELWVRYHPDGRRVLYCQFPENAWKGRIASTSEVGIFDRETGEKVVLNVDTHPSSDGSIQVAPTWSRDGNAILYGSAQLFLPRGVRGGFGLYVLRDV